MLYFCIVFLLIIKIVISEDKLTMFYYKMSLFMLCIYAFTSF